MQTTFILVTGSGPGGMQQLFAVDLPAVPLPGENIAKDGRTYRTLERSWRFEAQEDGSIGVGVGLLVEQIGGLPHVLLNTAGEELN